MARFTLHSGDEVVRSTTYQLLARLWLREVDADLLRRLRGSPLREAFTAAGGVLPLGDGVVVIDELAVDYCQLFLGPSNHLPPVQSVWQAGQFHGTPIDSMRQFMDVCGYDASGLPSGTMLDHLGVQLDMMGHILRHVTEQSSTTDGRDDVADVANSFFATHLRWPADFLESAGRQAVTDFYRSVVSMTAAFLTSEVRVQPLPHA